MAKPFRARESRAHYRHPALQLFVFRTLSFDARRVLCRNSIQVVAIIQYIGTKQLLRVKPMLKRKNPNFSLECKHRNTPAPPHYYYRRATTVHKNICRFLSIHLFVTMLEDICVQTPMLNSSKESQGHLFLPLHLSQSVPINSSS